MRIYKHNFKNDGKRQESLKWYCDVRVGGKRFRLPLFESKPQSQTFANKIGDLIAAKSGGETPGVALQEWVNQQSPKMQERFAQWGLISAARVAGRSSLTVHLDDWRAALLAGGTGQKQSALVHQRAKRVFNEAGFRSLSEITANRTMTIIGALQTVVHKRNPKTDKIELTQIGKASAFGKLHHLRACKQFTKWAYRSDRLADDPLQHLELKNVRVETPRRALSTDEITYLLAYVETAPERWNVSGHERALVYELALSTGLRKEEIASLKRTSFDFKRLTVKIKAEHTKNKKPALLPVKAALMDRIKAHLSSKLPTAKAFNVPDKAALVLQRDLAEARQQWIDAVKDEPEEHQARHDSDFLKIVTHRGKADFHSLRHTFGTLLAESGVHPKVAMDLMRHSDINLTLALYTHSNDDRQAAAIDGLPDFETVKEEPKIQSIG